MTTEKIQTKDIDYVNYKHRREVINREFGCLVGKTVKRVRPMTIGECELFAWDFHVDYAFLIEFTDGTVVIPSQDAEGNGSGYLFIETVG